MNEARWIIFHLALTLSPFIEATNFPDKSIYKDFGDIFLEHSSTKQKLSTLLSNVQFQYRKRVYSTANVLTANRRLIVMRYVSLIPFLLMIISLLLLGFEKLLVNDLDVRILVDTFFVPLLYVLEVILYTMRITCKAIPIIHSRHSAYKDVSLVSILFFTYFMKK